MMFANRLHTAAVLAALITAPLPATAATVTTADTKALTAKLEVADVLAKPPGLYENLATEGRRWLSQNRAEAEKAYKDDPSDFADGRRWTFERTYTQVSATGRYVGVLRRDYVYSGGAHPNTVLDTILWDSAMKRRISVRPFFTETGDGGPTMTALAAAIRAAVRAEKKARGIEVADDPAKDDWVSAIEPKLLGLGPLVPIGSTVPGKSGGLAVFFSPYAVGPYAEGSYTVVVPWRTFERFLSDEGRALFAGDPVPPPKDE